MGKGKIEETVSAANYFYDKVQPAQQRSSHFVHFVNDHSTLYQKPGTNNKLNGRRAFRDHVTFSIKERKLEYHFLFLQYRCVCVYEHATKDDFQKQKIITMTRTTLTVEGGCCTVDMDNKDDLLSPLSDSSTPTSVSSFISTSTDCTLGDALNGTSDFYFDMSDRWKNAFLSSMEDTIFPVKDLDNMMVHVHTNGSQSGNERKSKKFFSWGK
jgi:hypothetical protein